jgi:thiol-disulfide isomerase/thioredoxin
MSDGKGSGNTSVSVLTILSVVLISAAIGFAAVYVTLGGSDNAGSLQKANPSPVAAPKTANLKAEHKDDLAGFVFHRPAKEVPAFEFEDGEGNVKTLADFKGRWVLLNLWATWCAPCKAEMPSLNRLQQQLGSDTFEVLALSLDRGGQVKAKAFLTETQSTGLKFYIDPTGKAGSRLKAAGMPTTFLIDPDGKEVGRLVGPAEWDSSAAVALIEAARKAGS